MTNEEFRDRLLSSLSHKKLILKKNEQCYIPYGINDYIWYMDKGIILIERNTQEGALIGTGIYRPGMVLGVKSFCGDSNIIKCRAVLDAEFIGFKTENVTELLKEEPELMFYVLQDVCSTFDFALDTIEIQSLNSVADRIAFFEKRLREAAGDEQLDISDAMIAEYLGIHPVSVSRARKQVYKKNAGK